MKSKNIVIIPARGGSKRLPGKNIRPLNGVPLIAHSIAYARLFPEIIDDIYVSTDDPQIKQVSLEYGAKVIDRPHELATDNVPTLPVLVDALKQLNDPSIKNVILLQATNPLRGRELIRQAWEVYTNPELNLNSLFTVSRNYSKLGKIIDNKFIPYNYKIGQRSQDLEPLYNENGLLYISSAKNILENNVLLDKDAYPYVVYEQFLDIDTIEEFEQAEFVFKRNNVSYTEQ